jgi:hypothetical protein
MPRWVWLIIGGIVVLAVLVVVWVAANSLQ